jgi:hypothetical protein
LAFKGIVYNLQRSYSNGALKSLCFLIDADEMKPVLGTTSVVSGLTWEFRGGRARIRHRKLPLHDMYVLKKIKVTLSI